MLEAFDKKIHSDHPKKRNFPSSSFQIWLPALKIKAVTIFFCRNGTRISLFLQQNVAKNKLFILTALVFGVLHKAVSLLANPGLNWPILFPVPRIHRFHAYYEAHKTVLGNFTAATEMFYPKVVCSRIVRHESYLMHQSRIVIYLYVFALCLNEFQAFSLCCSALLVLLHNIYNRCYFIYQ